MVDENLLDDIVEALLAIIGFSLFFSIATIGTLLASNNPDSYIYIEFNPPEDYGILMSLLFLDYPFIFFFLIQTFKFKKSDNLNYRKKELLITSDKMKYYSLFYIPQKGFLIYFYAKYFESGLAIYLFLTLIFEIGLIVLIFYNSYQIKNDIEIDD